LVRLWRVWGLNLGIAFSLVKLKSSLNDVWSIGQQPFIHALEYQTNPWKLRFFRYKSETREFLSIAKSKCRTGEHLVLALSGTSLCCQQQVCRWAS
jgi:hypothetical protein